MQQCCTHEARHTISGKMGGKGQKKGWVTKGVWRFGEGLGEKVRVVGTWDVKCALNWFSFVHCME